MGAAAPPRWTIFRPPLLPTPHHVRAKTPSVEAIVGDGNALKTHPLKLENPGLKQQFVLRDILHIPFIEEKTADENDIGVFDVRGPNNRLYSLQDGRDW